MALQGKEPAMNLARRFGYGVPNLERATASALNHLALFAQAEIQPFKQKGRKDECYYYSLPIPAHMLEELENEIVELKVTLSYFVDPNRDCPQTSTRSDINPTGCGSTCSERMKRSSASNCE